jgi:hypothetical protein
VRNGETRQRPWRQLGTERRSRGEEEERPGRKGKKKGGFFVASNGVFRR